MGQIFKRAVNVAKSYLNDKDVYHDPFIDDDNELKKIIDNLSKQSKSSNSTFNDSQDKKTAYQNNNSQSNEQLDLDGAFLILKIDKNSSNEEIKYAYRQRIKEYHPDRLETFGDEIKELASYKTRRINQAFELIKKNKGF